MTSKARQCVAVATLTSKGQITIPKDVRERLGLEAGDRVVFVVESDRDVVLKPVKTDVRELRGMLSRKGQRQRTIEEMDEGIVRSEGTAGSEPLSTCRTHPGWRRGRGAGQAER